MLYLWDKPGYCLVTAGQGRVCVRTFVFELRARGPKARAKVDKFIDDAFEFYKMKKGGETDKSHLADMTELVYSCLLMFINNTWCIIIGL